MLEERLERALRAREDRIVDDIREVTRIRSVSSEAHPDLDRMAQWLLDRLAPLMSTVDRVPVAGAADAVIGRASGEGTETLLLYSHYDVQPTAPDAAWSHPPFGAAVSAGRIYGRGIVDDKADIVARIHALEIWLEVVGDLPASLVWMSEGAEEVGSPGLAAVVERELADDGITACLWESYLRTEEGLPELVFGCRGLLYVELTLEVLASDQHSSFATIARSATGEMSRALAGLTDVDGTCVIEGFLDGARPFTEQDLALIDAVSIPSLDAARIEGVDPHPPGLDARALRRRFGTMPTCNIDGFSGGFTDDGMQTVVASSARAKVDFRLLPGQDPENVAAALRRHLDRHGHTDIRIETLAAVAGHRSDVDTPFAASVRRAAEDVMGPASVRPVVPGTGPLAAVACLEAAVVLPPGAFRMSSSVHAPDENVRIDDLMDAVRFNLRLLEVLRDGAAAVH